MTELPAAPSPTRCAVAAVHPMLAGHFPGHPIVPGAWLLAWVVAAASQTRAIAGVKRVKFLRPLAPDQTFECALKPGIPDGNTMRFTLTSDGSVIAEGSLLLQPAEG